MRMARMVSVARPWIWDRGDALNESCTSGFVVAHASAALPRPGERALRPAVDSAPCAERLLGHGASPRRISGISRDVQRGALAWHAAGRVRQREIRRAAIHVNREGRRRSDQRRQSGASGPGISTEPRAFNVPLAALPGVARVGSARGGSAGARYLHTAGLARPPGALATRVDG